MLVDLASLEVQWLLSVARGARADVLGALAEAQDLGNDALLALDHQLYMAEVVIAKLERGGRNPS